MDRIIAHLDMDCFYCSCELKKRPGLKGFPIVVGSTGYRGVASAANYEAREKGVYSATPISEARKLCPRAVFLPVDMSYYKSESRKIMSILKDFSDDMQQVSIDEAYMDLTEFYKGFTDKKKMAKNIQDRILKETGLCCSIGMANSKVVAKIASDFRKPFGITVVDDAKEFLNPLPIESLPGIGKVTKKNYHRNGVMTIGDLANMDRFSVLDKFRIQGVRYLNIALGLDRSIIRHRGLSKSVGRERTFSEDIGDWDEIKNKLNNLCKRVYIDLKDYYFKTVSIKVRYSDFSTITRDVTLNTATQSEEAIMDSVNSLIDNCRSDKDIRLVGVKLSNLAYGLGNQTKLSMY